MVELLPCPFCGYDKARLVDRGEHPGVVFVKCNDCEAEGPPTGWGYPGGYQTRELAREKAGELWNRRAVVNEVEYWAGVIEQVVINGLAGASEFARIMARPGVSFTKEQDAKIHALVEAGDTAGAQRIILDALEVAFKQTS